MNMRNMEPGAIRDRLWWSFRTLGTRSCKWGNNVARHVPARPSVQGAWDPTTAALLRAEAFPIETLELPRAATA